MASPYEFTIEFRSRDDVLKFYRWLERHTGYTRKQVKELKSNNRKLTISSELIDPFVTIATQVVAKYSIKSISCRCTDL